MESTAKQTVCRVQKISIPKSKQLQTSPSRWWILHTGYGCQEKWAPANLVAQRTPSKSTYQAPDVKDTILWGQQQNRRYNNECGIILTTSSCVVGDVTEKHWSGGKITVARTHSTYSQ